MDNRMDSALFQATVLTFEELGFFFPTEEIDESQQRAPVDATAAVTFSGPFSGSLIVRICGDLLPTIAANMLGDDEPPSPSLQYDALGEIANVICGHALPLISGEDEIFHLEAPQVTKGSEPLSLTAQSPSAEAHVGLEMGRADVLLYSASQPSQNGAMS